MTLEFKHIHGRLDQLVEWRRFDDRRVTMLEKIAEDSTLTLAAMKNGLDANNAMTETIKNVVTATTIGKKFLIWVAGVIGAVALIWASIVQMAGLHTVKSPDAPAPQAAHPPTQTN